MDTIMSRISIHQSIILLTMTSYLLSVMSSVPDVSYVGEVLVYVDKSGFDDWSYTTSKTTEDELTTDINTIFGHVNQKLKSMESDKLFIQVKLLDVVLLKTDIATDNKKGKKDVWNQFQSWIKTNAQRNYDMAIFYTGLTLKGNISGQAEIKSVCSDRAVGVVQISNLYNNVFLTSHVIGHILGAKYDGSKGTQKCIPATNFVMRPKYDKKLTHFSYTFSSCSANKIVNQMDKLNKAGTNCMVILKDPGTADAICTSTNNGKKVQMARAFYPTYGNKLCTELACESRSPMPKPKAPNGMKCGENKRCYKGKCIVTANGDPLILDECPFGDYKVISKPGAITCQQILKRGMCTKNVYYKKLCCQTCNVPRTESLDELCRRKFSKSSGVGRMFYESYGDNICTSLKCHIPEYPHIKETITPEGANCGKGKQCIKGKCVPSSRGDVTILDLCPLGDQPDYNKYGKQWSCKTAINKLGCTDDNVRRDCCKSCHDIRNADQVCRQREGVKSTMARSFYNKYGDNLCSKLACVTSVVGKTFKSSVQRAPDGMACGKVKACKSGKCIVTPFGGDCSMLDYCPFDDQPWLGGSWNTTCIKYINLHGKDNACSNDEFKKLCCLSCKS